MPDLLLPVSAEGEDVETGSWTVCSALLKVVGAVLAFCF